MKPKLYPTITTTCHADWRQMIKDADRFSVKEVALFLTGIARDNRIELYQLLSQSGIGSIPLVHLRHDMTDSEIAFLIRDFKARKFNIHSDPEYVERWRRSKYRGVIALENGQSPCEDLWGPMDDFAGLCLDISHFEDFGIRQKFPGYLDFKIKALAHPIPWGHITGVRQRSKPDNSSLPGKNNVVILQGHQLGDLTELDYLKDHVDLLPEEMAIELENPIEEQLEAREYIRQLLGIGK